MKHLSDQEFRIAKLISRRKTSDAIEKELSIAPSTLRVHVSNICLKLEISSPNPFRVEQALVSYRHHHIRDALKPIGLSRGEREVVTLRIAGNTFPQIAKIRRCALSTALNLSSRACRKLKIRKSTNPATLGAALSSFDTPAAPTDPHPPLTMSDF